MNANDYRENGFVDMRAYLAQFGADDEAPQQMREHTRVLELEARIAKYEAALEWYADTWHYLADVEIDMGTLARKALGR